MEELRFFFTSLMDRGIWKAEGTRAEWTLKFETLVIIWSVLGLCRYTWAINQSESILNKMTKVARVNRMQELLTELPHQYFIAAYYCSPWWDLWGAPLPLVAENKSACMNFKTISGLTPSPPQQLRCSLNTLEHKLGHFRGRNCCNKMWLCLWK